MNSYIMISPKESASIGSIYDDATKLFNDLYTGLKDAGNYVVSGGDKPYVITRTITVKNTAPTSLPYWKNYSSWIAKATPAGYINNARGMIFQDGGAASSGGKIVALDFIFNGHKTVIAYNTTNVSVTDTKAAFEIDAEKAQKLRDLKYQSNRTVASLQKVGQKLIAIRKNYSKLNTQQKAVVDKIETKHNASLATLLRTEGIKVTATPSGLSGLGVVPPLVIAAIVIVVGVVAGFAVYKITSIISNLIKYQTEADLQNKVLDSYLAILSDPNASAEDKKKAQVKIDELLQVSTSKQSDLIKSEEPIDLLATAKTIGIVAVCALIASEGYKAFKSSK